MEEPNWLKRGLEHIWIPYAQMKTVPRPVAAIATSGSRITLADGRELVDGVASWWTAIHGYNHPELIAAATAQLVQMPHIMLGGLANEPAYRLATRLAELTPGALNHVFFSESGSVAVEVAMKMAVQYWRNRDGSSRHKFVFFRGGYHGDTFATMSVCDPEEGMHKFFAGALMSQYEADLPTDAGRVAMLEQLLAKHADIAAVIVEPRIQGASGMRMHSAETLTQLRNLCEQHKTLLIFDEIFTGFGRTGALFAADTAGVVPDIMTLGKALTGGVAPLAATVASSEIFDAFWGDSFEQALMHGPTYSGHALGCAVANASLDLFERAPRLAQIAAIGQALTEALRPLEHLSIVREVRVLGAVAAVELATDIDLAALRAQFIADGVFIRPIGRVIYLTPAYIISSEDLARLTSAVEAACLRLDQSRSGATAVG